LWQLYPIDLLYIGEEFWDLTHVNARMGESFDSLFNRFKREMQQSGILREIKRRQHFESPSMLRKKKAAAKLRKSRRNSDGRSGDGDRPRRA
jgi:small subunit ribosomal protein S21